MKKYSLQKLFWIAFLVVIAAVYNFVLRPNFENYSNIKKRIRLEEIRLAGYRNLINNKDIILTHYEKTAKPLEFNLPEEEITSQILSHIESLAKICAVNINSIRPQEIKDFQLSKKINVSLSFQSSWQGCLNFLYELENSQDFFKIEKLQLIGSTVDTEILNIDLILSKIFFSNMP